MMRAFALTVLLALAPIAGRAEMLRDITQPMVAVAGFDRAGLLGLWHEVARTPTVLEYDCHGVTFDFAPRDDGRLIMRLACPTGSAAGKVLNIDAVMVETSPGIFAVNFVRFSAFGTLELVVLSQSAEVLVLGSGLGNIGWVLTRDAVPAPEAVAAGVQVLVDNFYRPGAIARLDQE